MTEVWLNYDEVHLKFTTPKSGGEGKSDTRKYYGTDIQTNLILQTGRPSRIDTTHPIIFEFSWIIIQLEF